MCCIGHHLNCFGSSYSPLTPVVLSCGDYRTLTGGLVYTQNVRYNNKPRQTDKFSGNIRNMRLSSVAIDLMASEGQGKLPLPTLRLSHSIVCYISHFLGDIFILFFLFLLFGLFIRIRKKSPFFWPGQPLPSYSDEYRKRDGE